MQTIVGATVLAAIVMVGHLIALGLVRPSLEPGRGLPYNELAPEVRLILGRLCNGKMEPKTPIITTKDGSAVTHRNDVAQLMKLGFGANRLNY